MTTSSGTEYAAAITSIAGQSCADETDIANWSQCQFEGNGLPYKVFGGRGGYASAVCNFGPYSCTSGGLVYNTLNPTTTNYENTLNAGLGSKFGFGSSTSYAVNYLSARNAARVAGSTNANNQLQLTASHTQESRIHAIFITGMTAGDTLASKHSVNGLTVKYRRCKVWNPFTLNTLNCNTWTLPSTYIKNLTWSNVYADRKRCCNGPLESACTDASTACTNSTITFTGTTDIVIASCTTTPSDMGQAILDASAVTALTPSAGNALTTTALASTFWTTAVATGDDTLVIGFKPTTLREDDLSGINGHPGTNWYDQFVWGDCNTFQLVQIEFSHTDGTTTKVAYESCGGTI